MSRLVLIIISVFTVLTSSPALAKDVADAGTEQHRAQLVEQRRDGVLPLGFAEPVEPTPEAAEAHGICPNLPANDGAPKAGIGQERWDKYQ